MWPGSHGLRAGGLVTLAANPCVTTLPMTIAPAARNRATASASVSPLAARLGGTRDTFERFYGEPIDEDLIGEHFVVA